jgi:hypothetical protein
MKLQFAPVQLKAGNGVNFIVKKTDLPLMILLYMIRPTATPPQFHPASAWPSASLPRARRTSVLDCSPTPLAAGTARTPWPDCDWIFFCYSASICVLIRQLWMHPFFYSPPDVRALVRPTQYSANHYLTFHVVPPF